MNKLAISLFLCAALLFAGACSPRSLPRQDPVPESLTAAESTPRPETMNAGGSSPEATPMAQQAVVAVAESGALDMSFPQTFAITRPDEKISTTLTSYFITGTSDPSQPVYFGEEEITRLGSKGLFGVHVDLAMGDNTFTFSQGDDKTTVTITRKPQTTAKITGLVQESIYPAFNGSARAGGTLLAECTAPSGAKVTATFEKQTVELKQVAQANAGLPATFRGGFTLAGEYADDETANAGKIEYTMTYGGTTKTYESTGDVFVAGANSRLAVQVSNYLGLVYPDPAVPSSFREKLKKGGVDYIESQTNDHYKLSSGGYLPTEAGRIIEGKVAVKNTLSSVESASGAKFESYTFKGTITPVFFAKMGEGTFSLTLFNSDGTPAVDLSSSRLFSTAEPTVSGGAVTYEFTQKVQGNLWGYNVSYTGTDTVLRFAYKPHVSEGDKPLTGITIVLDPGHGDQDNGALGVPGKTGPDENAVNMAHALLTRDLLEKQGAKVLLTRSRKDEFLTLDQRVEFFEKSGADLFVSIHHNSLAESTDANTVSGTEVYYHSGLSRSTANKLLENLTAGTGRNKRKVAQSYYRVTILPYAPAVLCELGYLCNPLEYENLTSAAQQEKTAQALVSGIKAVFS